MRRVPQEYVEVARTVGANSRQVMVDVALRSMGPSLVDNLRITLGWCWTYLIIAEIVASNSGIGFVIWSARRFVKTPEVMAGVVVIGIIVGLLPALRAGLFQSQIALLLQLAQARAFGTGPARLREGAALGQSPVALHALQLAHPGIGLRLGAC